MVKVIISGLGKTGREIAKFLIEQDGIQIVSALCRPGSEKCGWDLGVMLGVGSRKIPVESSDKLQQLVLKTRPDVVIDFSTPEACLKNAKLFSKLKINLVIGTTGFSNLGLKRLYLLSKRYGNGVVYAPNITLGVNVLMLLTNITANILHSYDFQITEIHHKHKKDIPSGTAKKIASEIEKGVQSAGVEDAGKRTPITAVRAGGVVGKHEVMIIGEDDKIEISHESFSRKAFALGALKAVHFINGKAGYFEMSDVLNLGKVFTDYLQRENLCRKRRYSSQFIDVRSMSPEEISL
ncbi:MAG: 4-hydroxy-tetrahydrodipicolinate reductase [Carboxydocellales bacterium]